MWENCVVTKSGAELLGRLSGIELTGAKFGISTVPDTALAMQTNVTAPKRSLGITDFKRLDGGFAVVIRAVNTGVEEEYTIKQIGLYAREKDSEEEILLALTQDTVGERIPTEKDMPDFSLQFTMVLEISNEAEITAIIDSSLAISREQAERMIQAGIEPLENNLNNHIGDNVRHITNAERTKWNGKSTTAFSRTLGSGTKIGTITIDGTATDLYCQTNTDTTYAAATQSVNGLMTAADKKKLDGIAAGANAYTHPTTSGNKHIPAGGASGQILRWSADGTAAWGADNNTTYSNMGAATASAAGKAGLVPAPAAGKQLSFLRGDGTWVVPTDTTYAAVTQSANGLMSAADKKKLDGIATGANAYTHPTASGNKHIPAGGASGQILRWSADGTAAWGADNNTTYSNMGAATASAAGKAGLVPAPAAGKQLSFLRGDGTWVVPTDTTYAAVTQSANGLMTAADKKKLDGIAEGANAYAHPAYTARTGVPTANQTPAFGSTFSVTQPVSDASGHITAMNTRTVKIPNTAATASAAGLMSAHDKSWVDGKFRRFLYGADGTDSSKNGYYKIASVTSSREWISYILKLRITSDNFANYIRKPVELTVAFCTTDSSTKKTNVYIYADSNGADSEILEQIYIKYPSAAAAGTCEIYFRRTGEYQQIAVDLLGEWVRNPTLSTANYQSVWTFYPNDTLSASITATGYTNQSAVNLLDKASSVKCTRGSIYVPQEEQTTVYTATVPHQVDFWIMWVNGGIIGTQSGALCVFNGGPINFRYASLTQGTNSATIKLSSGGSNSGGNQSYGYAAFKF